MGADGLTYEVETTTAESKGPLEDSIDHPPPPPPSPPLRLPSDDQTMTKTNNPDAPLITCTGDVLNQTSWPPVGPLDRPQQQTRGICLVRPCHSSSMITQPKASLQTPWLDTSGPLDHVDPTRQSSTLYHSSSTRATWRDTMDEKIQTSWPASARPLDPPIPTRPPLSRVSPSRIAHSIRDRRRPLSLLDDSLDLCAPNKQGVSFCFVSTPAHPTSGRFLFGMSSPAHPISRFSRSPSVSFHDERLEEWR